MRATLDTLSGRGSAAELALAHEPGSLAAIEAMAGILDHAPAVTSDSLAGDTRITQRWSHGELHDTLPPLQTHVVMTFYGATSRELVWRTEGQRIASRARAGTITLIPAGHDGRWDIDGKLEVSHLYLPDGRLQAAAEALAGGRAVELLGRVAFADPASSRLLELLAAEAVPADPSSRLFVEQAVDLLCTHLVRAHSSFGALALEPRRGLADWQVKKVAAYMRAHLDEEVSLDDLAAVVSLSRFHFATAFRLATGRTPHDWLVGERIAHAQVLLANAERPVTEIALAVGYATPSSFAAAFRKVTGATPSEYRRAL